MQDKHPTVNQPDTRARPTEGFAPLSRSARSATAPTMVQQAYDHLLTALMTLQIAPGERIAIDQVARRLNISQTPVREALSQLEAQKLVSKRPNVGYRASRQMTRKEVRDLYALRQLIEPYAAARAAEAMTADLVAPLEELAGDMATIVDGDAISYSRFAEVDDHLHQLIATMSGNRLIADTTERLHAHMHIFRALYSTNAPSEAAAEHRALIDALIKGDPKAAERAMRTHLERSHERMDRVLAGDDEAVAPSS